MAVPNNGTLSIQGLQWDISTGQANIGPFNIPFSSISESQIVGANSTNIAILVPAAATPSVVVVAPNGESGMTASYSFISAQLNHVSPVYPSVIAIDSANVPANVYVSVSNTTGAYVTVQFA